MTCARVRWRKATWGTWSCWLRLSCSHCCFWSHRWNPAPPGCFWVFSASSRTPIWCGSAPSWDTRSVAAQRFHRILSNYKFTGEQLYAVEYLVLVHGVFEEVVAFEVFVAVCENEGVLELDGGGTEGAIIEDLVGGGAESEVEVDVVFGDQVLVYWPVLALHTSRAAPSSQRTHPNDIIQYKPTNPSTQQHGARTDNIVAGGMTKGSLVTVKYEC